MARPLRGPNEAPTQQYVGTGIENDRDNLIDFSDGVCNVLVLQHVVGAQVQQHEIRLVSVDRNGDALIVAGVIVQAGQKVVCAVPVITLVRRHETAMKRSGLAESVSGWSVSAGVEYPLDDAVVAVIAESPFTMQLRSFSQP